MHILKNPVGEGGGRRWFGPKWEGARFEDKAFLAKKALFSGKIAILC